MLNYFKNFTSIIIICITDNAILNGLKCPLFYQAISCRVTAAADKPSNKYIYIHFCSVHSQANEMVILCCSWISKLFAHCVSISATETIITHSAPLSIAVHLHQTLTSVVAPSESYHTIIWIIPKTRVDCNDTQMKLFAISHISYIIQRDIYSPQVTETSSRPLTQLESTEVLKEHCRITRYSLEEQSTSSSMMGKFAPNLHWEPRHWN